MENCEGTLEVAVQYYDGYCNIVKPSLLIMKQIMLACLIIAAKVLQSAD
jgi:Cyclin, N-terminal domain